MFGQKDSAKTKTRVLRKIFKKKITIGPKEAVEKMLHNPKTIPSNEKIQLSTD